MLELEAKGEKTSFAKVLADINARDEADMNRTAAPLKQAADAILLDTTQMDADEVLKAALALVRERGL